MRRLLLAALFALLAAAYAPAPARAVVDDRLDLNSAEAADFERFADTLEEVDVERILQTRVDNGDFASIEGIIPLIGEDKFTEIRDDIYVTVTRPRGESGGGLRGSAQAEVRDRSVNAADPLIKSRTNYNNAPEYRKEYELSDGDWFESYLKVKRSSWLKTNSDYVYDRRAAFNAYDEVKTARAVKKRSPKKPSAPDAAEPYVTMVEGPAGVFRYALQRLTVAASDVAAPTAEVDLATDEVGLATDEPDALEEGDDTDEVEAAEETVAPLLAMVFTAFKPSGGTAPVALMKETSRFSDRTGPVTLQLTVAEEPGRGSPKRLDPAFTGIETGEGRTSLNVRLTRLAPPAPATAEVALATSGIALLTAEVALATSEIALATAEVALATSETRIATTEARLVPAPKEPSFSITLDRYVDGRAEDELFHREFSFGTAETAQDLTLTVSAAAGDPKGPALPITVRRVGLRNGAVRLLIDAAVPEAAPAPTLVADDGTAPTVQKPRRKKKTASASDQPKKKRKKSKSAKASAAAGPLGTGEVDLPNPLAALLAPATSPRGGTTAEIEYDIKKVLRRRLELGNVTMAPVRKPLLGYSSVVYKRGAKYLMNGDGLRDTLIYANLTDDDQRLYGNHVEFDLPGETVVGSQLYRIEDSASAKRFTNFNLYAQSRFDETKLYGEFGRVPGGADALYLKSDTKLKKLSLSTIYNAIEPRYDDENALDPFSGTKVQAYTSAYLKALYKPDKNISLTAKRYLYARGELDLQNGETRNAADTFYLRYQVTPKYTLRMDLYRSIATGWKEGNYLRMKSMWDPLPKLRLEESSKYYDYNAAAGSTSKKNSQHYVYGAYQLRKGLVVKAKADRQNYDDRDVFTNTAGFEYKIGRSHYVDFEADNERITGKQVPTVQIETEYKAKYVYTF